MASNSMRHIPAEAQDEIRRRAIEALNNGFKQVEVSRLMSLPERTIRRWVAQMRSAGVKSLEPKRRGRRAGEASALGVPQMKRIETMVLGKMPDQLRLPFYLWTREAVGDLIARESIAPPDNLLARAPGVARAATSIVKIRGVARSCNRGQEGSGWVVAPERVVTNAHVVAGTRSEQVQIQGTGRSYDARVVVFDAQRDLAVLSVPGLSAPALSLGAELKPSNSAVVAGFPLDGPYRLNPARVRDVFKATGADIYGSPGVVREVYSLFARVEPGNSGGPLLSPAGQVVGIVFAKSLDDDKTAYALTLDEARPVLQAAKGAFSQVSTGGCAAA